MTTLSQFITNTTNIFIDMDKLDDMKDYLLEYEDRRLCGDGGYSFDKNKLKIKIIDLCQTFYKSNQDEFIDFCKTNKMFRENIYKQWLFREIDTIVCGKADVYLADSFQKDKGTFEATEYNKEFDYIVTWRGIFTVSIDKYYK